MSIPHKRKCRIMKEGCAYKKYIKEFDSYSKLLNEKRLRTAVLTNNEDRIREILLTNVDVNAIDENKRTALHLASSRGYAPVVELLLQFGADPSLKDSLGNTPLHLASCTGNVSVVKNLLAGGADAKIQDSRGCSPIQLAQGRLHILASWVKTSPPQDSSVLMKQVESVVSSLLASLDKSQADRVDALHQKLANDSPADHITGLLNELEQLSL